MGFFPFFIFFPANESFSTQRRAAQSFSVISVISGSETFVTKTAYQIKRISVSLTTGSRPFQDS